MNPIKKWLRKREIRKENKSLAEKLTKEYYQIEEYLKDDKLHRESRLIAIRRQCTIMERIEALGYERPGLWLSDLIIERKNELKRELNELD